MKTLTRYENKLHLNRMSAIDFITFLVFTIIFGFLDYRKIVIIATVVYFFTMIFAYCIKYNQKKLPKHNLKFVSLKLSFILWSFLSCFWSYNFDNSLYYIYTLALRLMLSISILIYIDINGVWKTNKIIIYSLLILSLRIVFSVPLNAYGSVRIGNYLNTNGNSYGNTTLTYIFGIGSCILLFSKKEIFSNSFFKFLILVIFTFFSLASGSKKEFFIIAIALLTFLIYKSKRLDNLIIYSLLGVLFLIVFYIILVNNDFLYDLIGSRLNVFINYLLGGEGDDSSVHRVQFIIDGINTFLKHPFIGVGLDSFKYFNSFGLVWAENNFIELLADLGVIGFFIYYFPYLYALFQLIKKHKYYKRDYCFLICLSIVLLFFDLTMVSYRDIVLQFFWTYLFAICFKAQRVLN